jgi:hypothetical protein
VHETNPSVATRWRQKTFYIIILLSMSWKETAPLSITAALDL